MADCHHLVRHDCGLCSLGTWFHLLLIFTVSASRATRPQVLYHQHHSRKHLHDHGSGIYRSVARTPKLPALGVSGLAPLSGAELSEPVCALHLVVAFQFVLERPCLVLQVACCSVGRLLDDHLRRKVHAGCTARVPHIFSCSFHRRLTRTSTERKKHPCLRNLAAWHSVVGNEKNHVRTFVDLGKYEKLRRPLPDSHRAIVN